LHGINRFTYDIDLNVSLDEDNLKKIIAITKKYKFFPRIPEPVENLLNDKKRIDWITKKGALVYTFISNVDTLQIDIFLDYPIGFDELYKNSDKIKIEKVEVLISSKEDLIKAKKKVSPIRDKDMSDIKELEALIKNEKKKK